MIITAMYMYGVIQQAWSFSIWHGMLAFIMDLVLIRVLSLGIGTKIIDKTSDEEKLYFKDMSDYFRKKWEVEELKRKMLDKKLYG